MLEVDIDLTVFVRELKRVGENDEQNLLNSLHVRLGQQFGCLTSLHSMFLESIKLTNDLDLLHLSLVLENLHDLVKGVPDIKYLDFLSEVLSLALQDSVIEDIMNEVIDQLS